jgi:hypothetical protein
MGTVIDQAIANYLLPITDCVRQTSDCQLVPITDCGKQTEFCRLPLVSLLPEIIERCSCAVVRLFDCVVRSPRFPASSAVDGEPLYCYETWTSTPKNCYRKFNKKYFNPFSVRLPCKTELYLSDYSRRNNLKYCNSFANGTDKTNGSAPIHDDFYLTVLYRTLQWSATLLRNILALYSNDTVVVSEL